MSEQAQNVTFGFPHIEMNGSTFGDRDEKEILRLINTFVDECEKAGVKLSEHRVSLGFLTKGLDGYPIRHERRESDDVNA